MKKGRSCYSFKINGDIAKIEKIINNYIEANQFQLTEKNGEKYYISKEARYFKYEITNDTLNIYAWLKYVVKDVCIEQDGMSSINIPVMSYRNSIQILLKEIEKCLNSSNQESRKIVKYDVNTGKPIYEDEINGDIQKNIQDNLNNNNTKNINQNNEQVVNQFEKENMKKKETMCEIGFWLSLFGLLCSFIGISYGVIIYIMDFYFASQGLKTRKRGKAIATIVLSIVSIVIILVELIFVNLA